MPRSKETMYPLVESYLSSKETQPVFCERHALSRSVFQYWLAKYRRQQQAPFIEVSPPTGSVAFAEVRFASGTQVRLLQSMRPVNYPLLFCQR